MYMDHAKPTRLPANGRLSNGMMVKLRSEKNGQTLQPARNKGQKFCVKESVSPRTPSHLTLGEVDNIPSVPHP
jgi:hypothetical protein